MHSVGDMQGDYNGKAGEMWAYEARIVLRDKQIEEEKTAGELGETKHAAETFDFLFV
jgi:hypothetical protein